MAWHGFSTASYKEPKYHLVPKELVCRGHFCERPFPGCVEVCDDCRESYCHCMQSVDHCCCVKSLIEVPNIPFSSDGQIKTQQQAKTPEEKQALTELQEHRKKVCDCTKQFCLAVAISLYKGQQGPGYDYTDRGLLRVLIYPDSNTSRNAARTIYLRMAEWLLDYSRCIYASYSFNEITREDVTVILQGGVRSHANQSNTLYYHRQRVEDYQVRISNTLNWTFEIALLTALYCSNHYRREPDKGIYPKPKQRTSLSSKNDYPTLMKQLLH